MNWKYVYGRSGNVIETNNDAPTIPLGYRNSAGDFCVWLVSALLVRQENEAIAHIMMDKMKETPDLVSGLAIKGRGHSKKLTLAVLDIPSVFVRGDKKSLKVFEPKWKKDGTKIIPDQFLNLSKKHVFLVLGILLELI